MEVEASEVAGDVDDFADEEEAGDVFRFHGLGGEAAGVDSASRDFGLVADFGAAGAPQGFLSVPGLRRAFGADDGKPTRTPAAWMMALAFALVPSPVLDVGQFSQALLGHSCQGRRPGIARLVHDDVTCDNRNGGHGNMKYFERITVDPAQVGGVPCVRGLRIPVATVLRLLAGGLSEQRILADYPDLEAEDIRECLRYAAATVMERELPLPRSA